AVHRAGAAHLGLRPEALIVSSRGASDFLKVTGFSPEGPAATGDARYLAPEQLRGEAGGARPGIFALGAILGAVVGGPAGAVVARACAEDPSARSPSAEALLSDLTGADAGLPGPRKTNIPSPPTSFVGRQSELREIAQTFSGGVR